MLLAVDVGNTDVTFGVFDGERLAALFRFREHQMNTENYCAIF